MSRNKQFAGFGRAVLQRMLQLHDNNYIDFSAWDAEEFEEYSEIIAQCAHDLAVHVIWHTANGSARNLTCGEIADLVPDLSVLPEEKQNG